jgi:hypothetical protein
MIEAWWAPESSNFVVLLLCSVGVLDPLLAVLASRGRHRVVFNVAWICIMILYGAAGVAGVLGFFWGQPVYIFVPLTVVGFTISVVHWFLRGVMKYAFLQAELRRSISADLVGEKSPAFRGDETMLAPCWVTEVHFWLLRHRAAVLFTWTALTVVSGLTGVAGVFAWLIGLPEYIWVPLLGAGMGPALALGGTLPIFRKIYARAELRKSVALDI